MCRLLILFFLFFLGLTYVGLSQSESGIVVRSRVVGNDTLPVIDLKELKVFSFHTGKSKRDLRHLYRLIRNVKKTYPYAKLAGEKLRVYNEILLAAGSDKERKQIMKGAEKEIKAEYTGELMTLTITQGKILIKLIERETGHTSYDLVAGLRGKFVAAFYQALGKVFGYNLKIHYDPAGEDKDIEFIVQMIENGQL